MFVIEDLERLAGLDMFRPGAEEVDGEPEQGGDDGHGHTVTPMTMKDFTT